MAEPASSSNRFKNMNREATLLDPALPASELGEGPVWDSLSNHFYWVDITGRKLNRYDTASLTHRACPTPSMVGFAAPAEDGRFVIGLQDGLYFLDFETGHTQLIVHPDPMPQENRFNDGKCDRRGRLWAGTMNLNPDRSKPTGSLYRFDQRGLEEVQKDICISNGIGFSPDNRTMYYTDTLRDCWAFDYDLETGTSENRRVFLKQESNGAPDGLTVDSQGRVFTARWDGWGVDIYSPEGKLEGKINVPVPQVSSCAFGGTNLKTLFITTAKEGLSPRQIKEAPLSGCVFAIEMDVPGMAEIPFRL